MSRRCAIALGSNLGDRLGNLQEARDRLRALSQSATLQSAIYETVAIDCEPGAQKFYNAVIEINFAQSADELLHRLQTIEEALGRSRNHSRNVSRTIDLDLLCFGGEQRAEAGLQLPHPRMREREFVLRPLADIAPELRLPGETASVRKLLARFPASDAVKCVARDW